MTCVIGPGSFSELLHTCRHEQEAQMSPKQLFAASIAALILACVAGWAVADAQAHAAAPATVQINPFEVMVSAEQW